MKGSRAEAQVLDSGHPGSVIEARVSQFDDRSDSPIAQLVRAPH